MWTRAVLAVSLLGLAGSCKSGGSARTPPPTGQSPQPGRGSAAATNDSCATAVDKIFALLKRRGNEIDPSQRAGVIDECRQRPDDPLLACVLGASDDAALERCMTPAPQGEPLHQLAQITQNLRTYFFVHETFTDQKIGLTPATPCCQFPTKKCPPETAPNEFLRDVLELDLSTEREFQYRFESSGRKAVIEAVGDRDCDGKTVTYRRELEQRADGNMHITVLDPPDGSD
jgi:hypothetical protein